MYAMKLDYAAIGARIARRRRELHLTQAAVAEKVDVSVQYISNIERAVSIPSTEVIMRIAAALDTTPDEFLVGTIRYDEEPWQNVSEMLRGMTPGQLQLAKNFLTWLFDQKL